jgi:hypothetical protein
MAASRRHRAAGFSARAAGGGAILHPIEPLAVLRALGADLRALPAGVPVVRDEISMKCAEVRHISAQAIISRKCAGATCSPPVSRQWFIAGPRHVL